MISKRLNILLISLLVVSCAVWPVYGQQQRVSEYQVKAAFLYNFAKFVEWPKSVDAGASKQLVLGILGKDPFGEDIKTIQDKRVKDRTLQVIRAEHLEELGNCDILFIGASMKGQLDSTLKELDGKPVLTVSDTRGFAQQGVMINLFTINNKIRFEINLQAVEQSGLKISSQLLKLATLVKSERQ